MQNRSRVLPKRRNSTRPPNKEKLPTGPTDENCPTLNTACCTKYPDAGSPLGALVDDAAFAASGDTETETPVCTATAVAAVAVCSPEEA